MRFFKTLKESIKVLRKIKIYRKFEKVNKIAYNFTSTESDSLFNPTFYESIQVRGNDKDFNYADN